MKEECCESEEDCETGEHCCESDPHHAECGASWHDPAMMAKMIYHKAMLEMVKERVKKKLEETHGKKADKLADLVLEGMESWKEMKGLMGRKCEWEKKVMEAMRE